ncbi:MAG: outer membrane protein assembly factor BamA [Planctomycetota bacterium]|jgi:outer membrane protein insertion porin family
MPGARCRRFRAACRAGFAAAAVWCVSAAGAATAGAQDAPPAPAEQRDGVRTIEFTGLRWARAADLLALMKTQAGRPFNRALFELDVVQLGKKGFFVRSESLRDGRLVLDIDERPTIRRIDVNGPEEVTVADVRAALLLTPGAPLIDEVLLERARAGVEALYRRKGYRFARVAITPSTVARGVNLAVRVDEGPRTYIEAITFHGAHGIDPDDLEDVMNTEASSWMTSKYLDHAVLEADIARLQRHYRELGWRDARVTLAGLRYSGDGSEVTIRIQVEEGPRYTVVGFRIEGNDAVTTEELTELVELAVGEPLDARRIFGSLADGIRGDVERMRAVYQDEGYYNVQIQPETRVPDPAKRELVVVYNIHEGQRTRIGRVDIIGNRITREDVIRRRLPFRPGDKIRTEALRTGLLQLMQTQYFAGVEPELRPSARPGFTDVIFKVQEAETVGNFNFGGALSQGSGFQATASLTINNFDLSQWSWPWNLFVSPHFRGGGQRLQASVAFGRRESNYTLTFNEPYLFGTRNSLSLTGQLSTQSEIDFDVRREGGGFTVGRRLFSWLTASVGLSGEFVRVDDVGFFAPQELFALEKLGRKPLVKMRGGLDFDWARRDIGRLPYRGFEMNVGGEWAHDVIGSHWSFAAVHIEPKVHWTLFGEESEWRHIITFRTSFDYAEPLDGQSRVPFFERYFAGGWGTIRGFDRRDVGPRENNRPVGGEFLLAGSLEYTFPLWRDNLGGPQHRDIVRAVLFYDFATLDHTFKDYSSDDWRTSVGFGFRLSVPGFPFPFALDFGWPIKKETGDDTQRISFTFDVRFG